MFPSIGAQGKSGLITTDRMESGDIGVLAEAPEGGEECGSTCGWDWEDSPGLEVWAHLGRGGLSTSHGCGVYVGTSLVRVSYLHTVGEAGTAAWEISAGSVGSIEDDGTGSSHVQGKEKGASHVVGRMSCGHRRSLALLQPGWMRASRERGGGGGGAEYL